LVIVADASASKGGAVHVADISGLGNDGIVTGATQIPAGRAGGALKFGGQDSVLLPKLGTHLTRDLKELTISLWVMQADIEGNAHIFDVGNYPNRSISLFRNQGKVRFSLPGHRDGGRACADTVVPREWHHVACVWNGSEQRLYVNAWLKAKTPTQGLALNTTTVSNEPARLGTKASPGREQWYFN
jgi:hypothetical protein